MTEEKIQLSEGELEQLREAAEAAGISIEDAAQRVMLEGLGAILTDISPSSMALTKILRDSKVPNK